MNKSVKRSTRAILAMLVIISCVGCDQVSKHIVSKHLAGSNMKSFIFDIVRIQYAENAGGFLSLGSILTKTTRFYLFTVVTTLSLVVIAYLLIKKCNIQVWAFFALVLILSGGIGNLIDRIIRDGFVVDFMNIGIGTLRTGIFNVADVAITTGVIILILLGLRRKASYA